MPPNPALLKSPSQRDGGRYEQIAAEFLQAQGLLLISSNWQQPKVGEIDLVLRQPGPAWDVLVFAEVRKRKASGFGDAAVSVTRAKQRKLIKTARYFLQANPQYAHLECRFDVLAFNPSFNSPFSQPLDKLINRQAKGNEPHSERLEDVMPMPEWIQGAFLAPAW